MMRFCAWTVTVGLMAMAAGGGATGSAASIGAAGSASVVSPDVRTMTGWFSDAQCAAPRVKKGIIAMNNPECVKKCLKDGVAPVFISEQAKAMFEVRGYPAVSDDVGWHVEVTGTIDEAGQVIEIQSVKRLNEEGAMCALPRKKTSGGAVTPPAPTAAPDAPAAPRAPAAPGARTRTSASGR